MTMTYFLHGNTKMSDVPDILGLIPGMLDDGNDLSAAKQLDHAYSHGGGWRPFDGFVLDKETLGIKYEDDPEMFPLVETKLRDERILFYPYAWVMILQPDNSFEICRMD